MYGNDSPFENDSCSWVYAKEDKSAAVLFYFTIANSPSRLPKRVTFRGLDPNGAYRLRGDDKIYSGDVLMNYGVKYVHNRDYDGTMFVAERV